MSSRRRLALALTTLGLVTPATARAACDPAGVHAKVTTQAVGAERKITIGGELSGTPRDCRDSRWTAHLEARDAGRWVDLGRQRLTQRMTTHAFAVVGSAPGSGDAVRVRFRMSRGGRTVTYSRSVLVDMSTFANLPQP